MKITARARIVAAIAAGAALAALLPASAAVSQASPPGVTLKIVGTATLADRGAVIFVPLRVSCPAGDTSNMTQITVTEAVGGYITQGGGFFNANCTGQRHRVIATVLATTRPFRLGSAYAQASIFVCCGGPGPFSASDARSIIIQ